MDPDPAPTPRPSPFFFTPTTAIADSLAILHLKRDSLIPLTLRSTADDGYAEGAVTNTRFGSFPHSTLIGAEWGSQVRASKVDTGSRGRNGKAKKVKPSGNDAAATGPVSEDTASQKKRKSDEQVSEPPSSPRKKLKPIPSDALPAEPSSTSAPKLPIEAGSGFVHILPPTPEAWTYSLDHRTQVVYTPDSSFILQQLRVRPGDAIIEAGAGSGSFTHAAARAIFNGYPSATTQPARGAVHSFEYHEPRVQTLRAELTAHGLDGIVHLTHRDVCTEGFALSPSSSPSSSPNPVTAIFLDLPAPWLALKHLTRAAPGSPLHPTAAVHICTFSPCIEQVMATTAVLRRQGWTSVRVCEVQNRRLDVRRERVGYREEGLRGVQATAATVVEAVARLREVEKRFRDFNAAAAEREGTGAAAQTVAATTAAAEGGAAGELSSEAMEPKQDRLKRIRREAEDRKLYREGNLIHRTESEIKTHTSYLVFAVLPREWGPEDERRCLEKWGTEGTIKGSKNKSGGK